jgi:tetratricopeptide (TPR) repeat protein
MQATLKRKPNTWVYLALVAAVIAVLVVLRLPRSLSAQVSPLFPYPYQTVSADDALRRLENTIAFYESRTRANPEGGLELASLAGAYVQKARVSGWSTWYLLADQAAKRSLANLPTFNQGALLVLAEIAEASHQFDEAIRLADQVLDYQASNDGAASILITANLAKGNLGEARRVVDELVTRLPTGGVLSLRALVAVAEGNDTAAQKDFEDAIGLEEPGDAYGSAWLRTQLGRLHARRGRNRDAETLYREALRIASDYALAQLSLAELKVKTGDYKTATTLYQDVLDRAKESSTVFDHVALQGLWRASVLQGDTRKADEVWTKAETIIRTDVYSGSFGHPRELARLLLERGDANDTPEITTLVQTERALRRDPTTLDIAAWSFMRLGQYDNAKGVLQEALAQGFQDAGLYYRAGVIEEKLKNPDGAKNYFEKALSIDPTFDAAAWRKTALD